MNYSELLKDPRWQKLRLLVFDRDNWTCQSCGARNITLHVHHLKYFALKPWEYPPHLLITYCEKCHETEHLIGSEIRESLLEIITANKIYIKPISQLCVLTEKHEPFYDRLKEFLNQEMISYLKTQKVADAEGILPT